MESEVNYIIQVAREKEGGDRLYFLLNKVAVMMYIAMADGIKRILNKGKILDWGCGYGHLSYLLKKRGFDIESYDINGEEELEQIRRRFGINCVYGDDGAEIPFSEGEFDAVVSCGVLEHVSDESASLREIFRVLRENGYFFIYMLPNLYSHTEFIADIKGRGVHPKKYKRKQIRKSLISNGFEVLRISYCNAIPKNLTGISGSLPYIYNRFYKQIVYLDKILTRVPPINTFSGVYSVICRKI